MVVDTGGGGEVFLLSLHVLLEGGASIDSCGAMNLDLLAVRRTLERVRAIGGGELSKGTTSEQGSSPFFADLGLVKLFLPNRNVYHLYLLLLTCGVVTGMP